jgi:hypothetical protein
LIFAVVLNGLVLAVSMYLTDLQGELQDKRFDEQYFIINDETKRSESSKSTLLQGISNQLVMLRRLADDRLTLQERETVLNNVKELNYQTQVSKVNVIALAYLLANEPPQGTNPFEMFKGKSDSELYILQSQYEKQAGDYAQELKGEMVQLMEAISFWQYFHSSTLVLSTIILIIGSILNFVSERTDTVKQTQ